jgi:hypothetical protein
MLNKDEVISFYTNLQKKVVGKTQRERNRIIYKEFNKYSLEEWSYIGDILRNANLI